MSHGWGGVLGLGVVAASGARTGVDGVGAGAGAGAPVMAALAQ
jgi:hypothetical protein